MTPLRRHIADNTHDPNPMPEHEPALPPREPLPRHTTPTWEMELLISGATVFALMQVPGLIDAGVNALVPRFDRDAGMIVLLPAVYLKSAVYALIITFIAHLAVRAHWVGLVGLSSVHPDGIRWENLRWGPHHLRMIRERMPPLPVLIERADNRASQVFGYGTGLGLILVAPMLFLTTLALVAYGLFELLGRRWPWYDLWNLLVSLVFVPYFLLILSDKWLGARLKPGGILSRALGGALRGYHRIGFASFSTYPVTLFTSHAGSWRGGLTIAALVLVLTSVSMVQLMQTRLTSGIGQFGPLAEAPHNHARTLDPQHYADQRDAGDGFGVVPYIGSEVVRGDYLRLFIPYRPARDNPALARACPGFDPNAIDALPDAGLGCAALLYGLALDGEPLADPRFDRSSDRKSGVLGVVAMIRVTELAPGRHELQVTRPFETTDGRGRPPLPPYTIAFWR
jgi:hypothetical protein